MSHFKQDHPFTKPFPHSEGSSNQLPPNHRTAGAAPDDVSRSFNTALVATRVSETRNMAAELQELMGSTAYNAIMAAVRQVARAEGISERQAAEQVIRTFRKMDQIWADYVFQEGVDRLRAQLEPR